MRCYRRLQGFLQLIPDRGGQERLAQQAASPVQRHQPGRRRGHGVRPVRQAGPGPVPADLVDGLDQPGPNPAVPGSHVHARPGQPHLVSGDLQQQVRRASQRRCHERRVRDAVEQDGQVLRAGDPHRPGQPPVSAVIPPRHHPQHRTVTVPDHRRATHPPHHRSRRHPAQRHRVITGRPARPLTRRHQKPVRMPRVIRHRVTSHRHQRPQRHRVRRRQQPCHVSQPRLAGQHSKVTQRVHPGHQRRERRPATQRVHLHLAAFFGDTSVGEHMPGRRQHARRHLEARPHRGAITVEYPAQIAGNPPVRPGRSGHDEPAATRGPSSAVLAAPAPASPAAKVTGPAAGRPATS